MPLVRLLSVFSLAPSLCSLRSTLFSLLSRCLFARISSPASLRARISSLSVSLRPHLFAPVSLRPHLFARTVAVEVHRSDRVRVCGELLQLLPRLHVPYPHRLVEASADDQVRLWVEVDAEDEVEVTHQCFEAEALDKEEGRGGEMRRETDAGRRGER